MIKYYKEPRLSFGFDQPSVDPRDGLTLFGPHEDLNPYSLRVGVVGTKEGLQYYHNFVKELNKPIISKKNYYGNISMDMGRPSFPGFESVFNIKWSPKEELFLEIDPEKISRILLQSNKKKRTSQLVDLYLNAITKATNEEDVNVDIWFLIVPNKIYKACKPQSFGQDFSKGTKDYMDKICLLYTSPSPRDGLLSRMPSSA